MKDSIGVFGYSFIVLSYNSAKTILQALESIKYQVTCFSSTRKKELIVVDDCSKDCSRVLIDRWIEINEKLFDKVQVVYNQDNLGTCYALLNAIDVSCGDYILTLAGDDMFSHENIIGICDNENESDIILANAASFIGNRITSQTYACSRINRIINQKWKLQLCFLAYINPVTAPGWIFKRALVNDEVRDTLKMFKLLDDMPLIYRVLTTSENIKIKYVPLCIRLYRREGGGVSQSESGNISDAYKTDLRKMEELIKRENRGIVCKYMFWTKENISIFNPIWVIVNILIIYYRIKGINKKTIDKLRKHLECINENAKESLIEH